jgi:O-acetyl-ADP-ribose deacetylase (regulator of RNase III)
VTANIFESPAQTLVNTVNTVGVMGKGIAADFKRRYPEMFQIYKTFCAKKQFRVGQLYVYRTANKWVLNFPTKQHWRNPSKIEWIEACLKKFVETYTAQGITSISFPQLGCGNGGLSWDEVRPLMERYLEDLPIPVYVHVRREDAEFHLADFPGTLRANPEAVRDLLLKLEYLEPMDFLAGNGQTERGIRFAPAPALTKPQRRSAARAR